MKNLNTLLTCLAMLAGASAPGQGWQAKIDPAVFQAAAAGHTVDCIVVMAEQADLSEAAFLPKKKDKTAYVQQRLTETATRTQVAVLQAVRSQGSPHHPFYLVNAVQVERADLALLETLARLSAVGRIDPNPVVRNDLPRADAADPGSGDRAIEWNVAHINADDVWTMGYDGTGVTVAGQDTGYKWDHAALINQYRGWNGSTADHNYNWHDAIHSNAGANSCGFNSPVPCDDHDHGTHTMGTMVGDDGAANQIGAAPGAKWIGCRNMDVGNGTPATYLECFEWFLMPTDLNNLNPDELLAPDVINNSWGCPTSEGCNSGNFMAMDVAINNLTDAGVMVVVSAGNSGPGCSTIDSPAAIYANSFTVGATNNLDSIAAFSSRGPTTVYTNLSKPEISAPGVSIRSSVKNGGYQGGWSGTSMAGPHVAAVVALMLDANPNLTVAFLKTHLQASAVDRTSSQHCGGANNGSMVPNNVYGHGRLDALAAVNAVLGLLPIELIDFQGFVQNKTVRLQWEIAPNGSLNHFELERASASLDWATVNRQVFSPTKNSYHHLDESPVAGINYYRLKMVDMDGSIEYSKAIAVRWSGAEVLAASPNPVLDALSLTANWQAGELVGVDVFDANGRLVLRQSQQVGQPNEPLSVNVAALPSGIYFLRVFSGNGAAGLLQGKFTKL